MRRAVFVMCCLIYSSICSDWKTSKWWSEENAEHECRACKPVPIDKDANCPEGYLCEEEQPLRASVLTSGSCHCQSIACANRDWRLAVNGSLVDRIRCEGREWYTIHGETVPSAVCVKESCPPMKNFPVADCNTINVPRGYECAEAVITQTSVSCEINTPGTLLYIVAPNDEGTLPASPFTCVGTDWTTNGQTLYDLVGATSAQVACMSVPPTTTTTDTPAGQCPEMTKYPVAACNRENPGNICAEAIITPTSVSCALPGSSLYIVNPVVRPSAIAGPLTCVGTHWTLPDGTTTLEDAIMEDSGAVACYKAMEITTELP